MAIFISTIRYIKYNAKDISNKEQTKARILEWRFWLKVEHHFSPSENSSSKSGVLDESSLKDTAQKRAFGIMEAELLHIRSRLQILTNFK